MSAVLAWIVAHEAVLAGVVVAVIDLVFALSPSVAGNGILQWLLNQAKALLGSSTPPPSA